MYNNNDLRGVDMNKHKKGSIFGIIGLVVIFAVVSFLFFSMISDQIFFKHVKSDIKIEIKSAMDSGTFIDNEKQKYQFLDLSKYQGIDKNRIKRMLVDRPTLLKHTDDFLKAAKDKHVNEVYLISHALLETGAVKSELANGVEIDGKKYYNFYGVGALDKDPIKTGAEYAKKHGWDTPEKAISGGADFIHKHFLSSTDQNTLYSMRWNPKNPGEHQYATDIKWAESNATIIADFYKNMKTEGKYFKYFVYKDDSKHLNK